MVIHDFLFSEDAHMCYFEGGGVTNLQRGGGSFLLLSLLIFMDTSSNPMV